MRAQGILSGIALAGLVIALGGSASAHHPRGVTRHHAHGVVYPAYPRQAYYWQYGPRPPLQALGGYCPPPRIIPHNRDADNARDVDDGEYCE